MFQRALDMAVVKPDGRVTDATGAVFTAAEWAAFNELMSRALLIGLALLILGVLTLVGVRLAGAGLLAAFGFLLSGHVIALLTIGTDYLLHGSLIPTVLSLVAFLSMIDGESLNWIRRG